MIDFKAIEKEIIEFWDKEKIYEKVKEKNKGGKKFYFLQGPPYTSGRIHIGQAWNNSMKDLALRFFRMKGYDVWDRAGYDMHGLPTANKVQKKLGLKTKKDIEAYGVDKFNKACYDFSADKAQQMSEDLKRLGVWLDYSDPYMPIHPDFMSSEWLLIKKAYEQNRLYKDKKIMQWCAHCETSLAKHELEYKNVEDTSIFVKFKLKGKDNEFLIIWTTTPWTIPFNLAVMVNPNVDYVKAEVEFNGKKEKWILAKQLSGIFLSGLLGLEYNVAGDFKGSELEGLEYEHPFYEKLKDIYDELKKKWPRVHSVVLSEEYVDTSAGSGLVHCAPGCGPEDYEVGKKYGIGTFNTLDERGYLRDVGEFSGWRAKEDDPKFIDELEKVGALIKKTVIEHEYAHCWRCHKPVVFRATEQWFLKIEDLVPKILEYNKTIKWVPKTSKKNYELWIKNLRDNGITRQRFWGTPTPIWKCECGEYKVIGSLKELKENALNDVPDNLHRPWIDYVKLKCPKCGGEMTRIPDVLDVWIDSGVASWACLYYPERKDLLEKYFPADLILEATEQTRLWFSMLQLCSTIVFDKPAYKGAYTHGMIFDFEGMKMSKSLGNIISPEEVIKKYSSDILRYYICETGAGKNISFNWETVAQKQKNLVVLMNTANYLIQLHEESGKKEKSKGGVEEKYILSRVNNTIKRVTNLFEEFRFDETITEIEKLFLDISRIYIKLTREKSLRDDVVYETLKKSFVETLKMFATSTPFVVEKIWQDLRSKNIVEEQSVHLCSWPEYEQNLIDEKLEERFQKMMEIIEKGLFERDKEKVGLKWPLPLAKIKTDLDVDEEMERIIKNQLNVKKIVVSKSETTEIELDFNTSPELEAEGFAREITRRIQAGRRKAGLKKSDRIELFLDFDEIEGFDKFLEWIKERVGAEKITNEELENPNYKEDVKIKGKSFLFSFSAL